LPAVAAVPAFPVMLIPAVPALILAGDRLVKFAPLPENELAVMAPVNVLLEAPSSGTLDELTASVGDCPPVEVIPAPAVIPRMPELASVTPPPKVALPPPLKPVPAVTESDGLASMALVTPPVAILNVPLPVIGPPVKPAPLTTLVTVFGKV
jgi:hypothetical protein